MLDTDSMNYEVLVEAAQSITDVPGLVLEIGTRRGGSLKLIIDNLQSFRHVISVDPYGQIDYRPNDVQVVTYDYTNEMRNSTWSLLFSYIVGKGHNLVPIFLEDTEFFKRYSDGVPVYNVNRKEIINQYALVFFDGPHNWESVLDETKFFMDKISTGTFFVYDDVCDYDHDKIDGYLISNGFDRITESTRKISYRKT